MRIGSIIVARMASERFPGKSMADLYGKPMIEWLVDKSWKAAYVDEVIVATTIHSSDDAIADYFKDKCTVFRGDIKNSQKRTLDCMQLFDLSHIILLSGDSPMIDPENIDVLGQLMHENPEGYDTYGIRVQLSPTPLEGLYCGSSALSHYESIMALYWSGTTEQQIEYVDCPSRLADLKGYMPKTCFSSFCLGDVMKTNMKLSIDYPAELMMANAVCQCLGHFPKNWEDIHRAYKNIKAEHFKDPPSPS